MLPSVLLLKFKVLVNQLLGVTNNRRKWKWGRIHLDHHGCDYLVSSKTIIATKVVTKGMKKGFTRRQ
jgi:hypothetical protein